MFKKLFSILFVIILLTSVANLNLVNVAEADQTDAFVEGAGLSTNIELADIIASVITAFLSLLGIIFLILIIYGGYLWMTAGGNEEQVTKAMDIIKKAIIGLIIIVSAYAITYFVFSNLSAGGGSSGSENALGTS